MDTSVGIIDLAHGQEKMSRLKTLLARQGQAVVAALAPAPAPVAPPAEIAVSAPAKTPAKAQPKAMGQEWTEAGARAVLDLGTAHAPEQALRPALSAAKTPDEITFTIGTAEGRDQGMGNIDLTLTELAATLTEQGQILHTPADGSDPKADLPLITASPSRDGRHKDVSATAVSLLLLDADGCGDLSGLRKLLTEEGIAHIWAWSSRCAPDQGVHKYHVIIPLAAPVSLEDESPDHETVRATYKHPYYFAIGALAKMASIPAPGLDPAMASPMQPFYVGRRLSADASPRRVSVVGGRCLDLMAFVHALGFGKVRAKQEQVQVARRSETRAAFEGLICDGDENKRLIAARCDIERGGQFWGVGASEPGRNNFLYDAATRLGVGFDLSESTVELVLRDLAATMVPPYEDENAIQGLIKRSRKGVTEAFPFKWKLNDHVKFCAKCRAAQNPTSAPAPVSAPTPAPTPTKVVTGAASEVIVICPQCFSTSPATLAMCKDCGSDLAKGNRIAMKAEPAGESETAVSDGREVIAVNDRTDAMAEGVVQVLSDATKTPNLFQRAGSLVEILNQPRRDRSGDTVYTPALRDLPDPLRLAHLVAPRVAFKTTKKLVPPPPAVMKMVMLMGTWPGIRPIEALISCPIVRRDGQVRTEAGYDAATHCYLIKDVTTDPIGETAEDATAALAKLLGLLADFPFRDRARGQSVWLSALLTLLTRGQFDVAPLFLARGNAPGCGKGTLMDLLGLIAEGEKFATTPYEAGETDRAKTIFSCLREGASTIYYDNVSEKFAVDSTSLALSLTSAQVKARILSVSETEAPANSATWLMSGNGTVLSREIARRTLVMDLFTTVHAGQARDYKIRNITKHVRANRGEYLAAALTIFRAWAKAGHPTVEVPGFDTFEDWCDVVRQCVLWASTLPGMAAALTDPTLTCEVTGTDEVSGHARLCALVEDVLTARKVGSLSAADMLADLGPSGAVKALTEFFRSAEERFPANPSFWAGKILGVHEVSKKGRVLCADGCERWLTRDNKGQWKVGRKGDAPVKTETPAQRMTTTGQVLAAVPGPF